MTVDVRQLGPNVWEERVATTAPAPDAFDYVIEFELHPEWEHELLAVKRTSRRAAEPGGEYLKTYGNPASGLFQRMFSNPLRVACRIKAVDRPERIVWQQFISRRASGPGLLFRTSTCW